MNAVPVTHACLGNHEFDHSIETLGQRLGDLEASVVNSNVFACPSVGRCRLNRCEPMKSVLKAPGTMLLKVS
jgi:2',3'-cyclic-nucleotide 2'-phosphodiesterase (5'-nucleotidase family)